MNKDERSALATLNLKRADGLPLPTMGPNGWVPLHYAVGKILWEAIATAKEHSWSDCVRDVVVWSGADGGEIGEWIAENLTTLFATGVLRTGSRPVGGGAPVQFLPPDIWDTDDKDLRFRSWSIDPSNPLADGASLPHWLFVSESDLSDQLKRIYRWRWKTGRVVITETGALAPASFAFQKVREVLGVQGVEAVAVVCWLAASGGVSTVAAEMIRAWRGTPVLREKDWVIPADVWAGVDAADSRNDIQAGDFYAQAGPVELQLSAVAFDTTELAAGLRRAEALISPAVSDAKPQDAPTDGAVGRPGRKPGKGGFAASDAPLVEEMKALVDTGEATSPWDAAGKIAGRAKGSQDNAQTRLVQRYYDAYPADR